MADYLHGAETQRITTNTASSNGVDTAITAIIGTAPVFEVDEDYRTINEIVDINDTTAAAGYFGSTLPDYTIPSALEDFFKQGSGRIFVINVFDPSKHKASYSGTKTFVKGQITLNEKGVANLTVTKAETPAVLDTDYTFDGTVITVKSGGTLSDSDEVTINYDYADLTKLTPAEVIGGIDENGKKYGAELLYDVQSIYGVTPRIIIAPGFSNLSQVATALDIIAEKLGAVCYIDADEESSLDDIIKSRNQEGAPFNTSSERLKLLHQYVKVYNKTTNSYEYRPTSPFAAGLRANLDNSPVGGVHVSSSNHAYKGVEGVKTPVSFRLNDKSCDANKLNSYGITTIINAGGEYREWGNRNASFPQSSGIMTFESCVRAIQFFEDSIEKLTLDTIDAPLTTASKDRLLEKIRNFFNVQQSKGATLGFDVWIDPAKNPSSKLADGWLTVSYSCCPPPPMERVTYENDVTIKYLDTTGDNE